MTKDNMESPQVTDEQIGRVAHSHISTEYFGDELLCSELFNFARALLSAPPAAETPDSKEDAFVIDKLGNLLAGVCIALKGEEMELHRHSYHDIVEVATSLKLELDLYRSQAAETPLDYEAARTEAYRNGAHDERVRQAEERKAASQEAKPVVAEQNVNLHLQEWRRYAEDANRKNESFKCNPAAILNFLDYVEKVAAAPQEQAPADKDAEIARLNAIINTPQSGDFLRAVSIESEHQRQRWGSAHNAGKTAADWFWLIGYLAGKALHAHAAENMVKTEHHIITTAAALMNWHLSLSGGTDMRPGIDGEFDLQSQPQHTTQCEHRWSYFGDQQKQPRCDRCNKIGTVDDIQSQPQQVTK